MAERSAQAPKKVAPKQNTQVQAHSHEHHQSHEHTHDHTHDPAGESRGEQKVTVADAGPARKSLTIEIPADRIKSKIESSFSRLQNDAVVPGFRRGRAPQRLLERRFGSSIREDVRGQLLSESYTQAVEDEKLDVIGEPEIKDIDQIKLPEDGPLVYTVEVEVSPSVELPSLEGLAVNKVKKDVTDEQITGEIDRFCERYGKMVDVPDAKVSENDFIQANVRILAGEDAKDDGEEISHQKGVYVQVAGESRDFKGHVVGIVVDDLGKRLTGKKPGDVVRISMTGPISHENDKVKGKPITIVIHIDKVERLEPASVESIVTQLGVESAEDLRKRVREMLEQRRDREQQSDMHKQIAEHLLEKVTLDLPKGLTDRQSARVLRRQALELSYQGVAENEIESRIADLRQSSEDDARKQLKLFFILDQAAKQLDIDVTENEVNGRIAMLAMQQGRRPEKLRQQMQRSGELEHLFLQIREQKTLDKIIERATVTEVDAPPAEEKAGAKKEKKAEKKASGKKSKED